VGRLDRPPGRPWERAYQVVIIQDGQFVRSGLSGLRLPAAVDRERELCLSYSSPNRSGRKYSRPWSRFKIKA
jgi:hypothetical protein